MNKLTVIIHILFGVFLLPALAKGQNAGDLDYSFKYTKQSVGKVTTIVVQPDGKILVGAYPTSFSGGSASPFVRLNIDGTLDTTFKIGSGFDNVVYSINLQKDGKIIVGGWFPSFDGISRYGIARLYSDGTLDRSFNPGKSVDGFITCTAIQPNGKILIGGQFDSYNGLKISRIARLNSDGSLDTTFNPKKGPNTAPTSIIVLPNKKIIVSGYFYEYNNIPRNYLLRLNSDGSLDKSFNEGIGPKGAVLSTSIQPNGKIIIAGEFNSFNGINQGYITRINSDGSLDPNFKSGLGANWTVHSLAIQQDGKILVGGIFTSYNGVSRRLVARLNSNGSLDKSFNPRYLANSENSRVRSIIQQKDGKILVGGDFDFSDQLLELGIIRFHGKSKGKRKL